MHGNSNYPRAGWRHPDAYTDAAENIGRWTEFARTMERGKLDMLFIADSVGIYPEFIDGYGVLVLPTTGRYMHVPYRATVPKGVRGLLVAGRAIGGDRIAHAATRNMACCAVAGQGAGVAAAVSLRTGRELDRVDMGVVQAELERQGVRYR